MIGVYYRTHEGKQLRVYSSDYHLSTLQFGLGIVRRDATDCARDFVKAIAPVLIGSANIKEVTQANIDEFSGRVNIWSNEGLTVRA